MSPWERWLNRRGRSGPRLWRRLGCAIGGHPAYSWTRGTWPRCSRCGERERITAAELVRRERAIAEDHI